MLSHRINAALERWKNDWQEQSGDERVLRVRWLLNPNRSPLRNVQITEQQGVLTDVRLLSDADTRNVLPAVLIPPLVNAHTHLEFSTITAPLQPHDPFQAWIRSLLQWRNATSGPKDDVLRAGLRESRAAGVGAIGEISTVASEMPSERSGITVVSFCEAIGLQPPRIRQQIENAEQHLADKRCEGIIRGLSPHAPYSVHPELLSELVLLAVRHQAPVAMHLAETRDELELLTEGRGPFREFLAEMGLFDSRTFPGGRAVIDFLQELSKASKALAIHGNYFSDPELSFLAAHPNVTTVYCPRTHAYFGHPAHPFRRMLSAGISVILGTDSRASNPDLNLWSELRLAAQLAPELSPGQLLAMVTTDAASALGLDPASYQIEPGGPFAPGLLTFDEELSDISAILRHSMTTPDLMKLPKYDHTESHG